MFKYSENKNIGRNTDIHIQAHDIIIEEEADLDNEIRLLEKQKKIAELKKKTDKGFESTYAPAITLVILCILIMVIYGLVVVIKKRKAQIQKGVTDDNNDNQAHEVIIEEEADLENEIRILEKQKRVAELKKEIKDLEAVHLAPTKSIIANPT
ncbi:3199_t:CDS:2 [Cetraspora pellucida]|uniref:3199_t:CDS:1 n=1 Tax=Cetraspora pellucida TaxID=1433469 RepID=A0A9N9GSU7_9GLOM|nr:3199_t:CDS:2 [Cetraspora pellucida]